jgi:hypothetical protein
MYRTYFFMLGRHSFANIPYIISLLSCPVTDRSGQNLPPLCTDKNAQKFRKYTIVIWVQPKYTLTFPCVFVYTLFEPKSHWYIYGISLPLSNSVAWCESCHCPGIKSNGLPLSHSIRPQQPQRLDLPILLYFEHVIELRNRYPWHQCTELLTENFSMLLQEVYATQHRLKFIFQFFFIMFNLI